MAGRGAGKSLRRRLVFAAVVWIVLGVGLAALLLSAVFLKHVDAQVRDELAVHLEELEGLTVIDSAGLPTLTRPLSDPRYAQSRSGYYWEITKGTHVVAKSNSLAGGSILPHPDTSEDGKLHFHEFFGPTGELLLAEKVYWRDGDALRFMISADRRHIDSVMRGFQTTLAWAMSAFASSLALAAVLLIVFALRPLGLLHDDLRLVRGGKAKRLLGSYPEEVQPLIDDLNAMLDASAQSVEKARAQAGNLAHGLKTPLAILTDEAHALEQSGFGGSAEVVIEQCHKMRMHIDYQLARARAAAGRAPPGTTTSVGPVVDTVARALRRLHAGRNIAIETSIGDGARVACDAQDLNEMIANLVDNACKHARSRVLVSSGRAKTDADVAITVDDDGPGLPPEAYEAVFRIGERWDSSAQGAGLGLPIVRDLAHIYGGSVELQRSELGGLRVRLLIPGTPGERIS